MYLFGLAWFFVALTSSAIYLLVITHVSELIDYQIEDWKFRLTGCLCCQFSWSISRFIALGIVYFCNEWSTVLILITLIIATTYLFLDNLICDEEMKVIKESSTDDEEVQKTKELPFYEAFKSSPVLKANLIILSFTWFTLGVTFYGFLHSWCKISSTHMKFENDVLSAILGAVGEVMALLICIAVKRKNLPFTILLLVLSICYFVLIATTDAKSSHVNLHSHEKSDNATVSSTFYENTLYVAHIISFISAAAFAILWTITIEMFPQNYRQVFSAHGKIFAFANSSASSTIYVPN